MRDFYWYLGCPICFEQGRLFIVEDISNYRLYLHCEECESGFSDPDEVKVGKGFLTFEEKYEYRLADLETITRCGWQKYALNQIPESLAPQSMRKSAELFLT